MNTDLIRKVRKEVLREQKRSDGIPQIVGGILLVIIGLLMLFGKEVFTFLFIAFIPGFVPIMRRRFTYPRVGFAEIRHNQKHRYALPIVLGMLAVLVVGMTCFQLASKTSPENRMLLHISLMLMIALCVVILLLYRTVKERNWITLLFALQIIAVIAGAFVLRLGNEAVIPVILILGTMESLVGLFLLTRFTKRYPVLENAD